MTFKLLEDDQLIKLGYATQASLYKEFCEFSKTTNTCWIRPLGFLVGVASGLLMVATLVGAIAEGIFKGLLNVGGCCFASTSFTKGIKMLASSTICVIGSPIILLASIIRVFDNTIGFLFCNNPTQYAEKFWFKYDSVAKAQNEFKKIKEAYDAYSEDKDNVRELANCYQHGVGTEKNLEEATRLYQKASDLGDRVSTTALADFAREANEYQKCWELYNKASEQAGSSRSNYWLGMIYDAQGKKDEAVAQFGRASSNHKEDPYALYMLMKLQGKDLSQADSDVAQQTIYDKLEAAEIANALNDGKNSTSEESSMS